MVYRRMNGFRPFVQLRDEMDRLVGDFFGPTTSARTSRHTWPSSGFPALNIWEEGDALFAEAEVPGMKSEEIDISVIGGDLTIRGHRGAPHAEGVAFHRQERGVGEF